MSAAGQSSSEPSLAVSGGSCRPPFRCLQADQPGRSRIQRARWPEENRRAFRLPLVSPISSSRRTVTSWHVTARKSSGRGRPPMAAVRTAGRS